MKTISRSIIFVFAFLLSLVSFNGCADSQKDTNEKQEKQNIDPEALPEISFKDPEHDFGKVTEGEKVGWFFYFTNTGGQDLIIQNVTSSCGCTIPDYSREPVPPGGEGSIKVLYNSLGRNGFDTKYVNVVSNAKTSNIRLKLEVEIIKKSNL